MKYAFSLKLWRNPILISLFDLHDYFYDFERTVQIKSTKIEAIPHLRDTVKKKIEIKLFESWIKYHDIISSVFEGAHKH